MEKDEKKRLAIEILDSLRERQRDDDQTNQVFMAWVLFLWALAFIFAAMSRFINTY
jgi:hypothetical protein